MYAGCDNRLNITLLFNSNFEIINFDTEFLALYQDFLKFLYLKIEGKFFKIIQDLIVVP